MHVRAKDNPRTHLVGRKRVENISKSGREERREDIQEDKRVDFAYEC